MARIEAALDGSVERGRTSHAHSPDHRMEAEKTGIRSCVVSIMATRAASVGAKTWGVLGALLVCSPLLADAFVPSAGGLQLRPALARCPAPGATPRAPRPRRGTAARRRGRPGGSQLLCPTPPTPLRPVLQIIGSLARQTCWPRHDG